MNLPVMPPEESELRRRMRAWVATAMQHVKTGQLPESEVYYARVLPTFVPGLRNVIATDESEEIALSRLNGIIIDWVERRIAAGKPLPELGVVEILASPEIIAVIRMSTLRALVLKRGRQWGITRKNLRHDFLVRLAAKFDALVTCEVASLLEPSPQPSLQSQA